MKPSDPKIWRLNRLHAFWMLILGLILLMGDHYSLEPGCFTLTAGRWPIQASPWLEWGSSTAGEVFPRLVRAFVPSSRTQSPPALHNRSRSGENCSIPSLPDVHTIPPLPAFTPASQKRARRGPRIAMNVAKLFNKLQVITNVEIVVPFLPEMFRIADQPPRHPFLH